jgi:hypothetical protein
LNHRQSTAAVALKLKKSNILVQMKTFHTLYITESIKNIKVLERNIHGFDFNL